MKIKADKLADAIELEFQGYSDEVREELAAAYKKIGAACVKKLKETSPKHFGNYGKSWSQKITATDAQVSMSVYNKKYAGLTHLLERGHAKSNGGRVEGIPHIAPVQEWADEEALDAAAKILGGD